MKELEVFLKTVVDGMKGVAQGIEALAEKLDTITKARMDEKAKVAKKAPAKKVAAKKAPAKKVVEKAAAKKPATAVDTVLKVINRSKKGVDTAAIMKKTGFSQKKIHNVIYKLKKQGKVKSVGKGVYLKG